MLFQVIQLQAAQAAGNGIITKFAHTTVANPLYGIEAGNTVEVT